jgi:hypothetical protein
MSGHAVFPSWAFRDRLLHAWPICQSVDPLSRADSTGQVPRRNGPDGGAAPSGWRIEIGVPDAGPGYDHRW